MGSDVETIEETNKSEIEKIKIQTETDLKTAISQLRQCEEATEDKITQITEKLLNQHKRDQQTDRRRNGR